MSALLEEARRFRAWADDSVPPSSRVAEWECDYNSWDRLYGAVIEFVESRPFATWTAEEVAAVLYAIARDHELELLGEVILARKPEVLSNLTRASIDCGEPDARWQLAQAMGQADSYGDEEEGLLLILVMDECEYVRRKALEALARQGSPAVTGLALAAWDRSDERQDYSRMMALWALHRVGSPQLERFLVEAERDSRPYLVQYASRVRAGDLEP